MRQNKIIFLLIVLTDFHTASVAQSETKADPKIVVYLKSFRSDYIKSMLDKNPEMIQAYYADNIRLMPELQSTILGKKNALAYHKAFASRFDILEYDRVETEILDLGIRIVETGNFSMRMKLKSTAKEYELKGKYQDIWHKPDDKLYLITSASNHNNRTEIDEQFRFAEVPAVQMALQAHVPVNNSISFELAALNKLLEISIIQHDSKIWSQFYTDDVLLAANLSSMLQGKEAVIEYLEQHVNGLVVFEKLDIRNDHIDNLGAYVIEYASHIAICRNGEWSNVNTGKNIRIWRREPDHSLKIMRQIGSYD